MFYVYTTVSLTLILESCLILSYMFDQHISNIVSKTYSMLGLMQRNFRELSRECFVVRYKSWVRPHLEYANTVWKYV